MTVRRVVCSKFPGAAFTGLILGNWRRAVNAATGASTEPGGLGFRRGRELFAGEEGEEGEAGEEQGDGGDLGDVKREPGLAFVAAQVFEGEADGGIQHQIKRENGAVFLAAGIGGQILRRRELAWVDEDRRNDVIRVTTGFGASSFLPQAARAKAAAMATMRGAVRIEVMAGLRGIRIWRGSSGPGRCPPSRG